MADLEVDSMSDTELRTKLAEHGFPNMPITASTRKLLAKKLKLVLSEKEKSRNTMNFSLGKSKNTMKFSLYAGVSARPSEISPAHQRFSISDTHQLYSMPDAKIQEKLCQHGFPVMPITATTRGFYVRLLLKGIPQKGIIAEKFAGTGGASTLHQRGLHRCNIEQYESETVRGNNERAFDLNFETLRLGVVPGCNRNLNERNFEDLGVRVGEITECHFRPPTLNRESNERPTALNIDETAESYFRPSLFGPRSGPRTSNMEPNERPTALNIDETAESYFRRPLLTPRSGPRTSNREPNERPTALNVDETAESYFRRPLLTPRGGPRTSNREPNERPTVRANGQRPPELTSESLGLGSLPRCNRDSYSDREQNEPATVQAIDERSLERNIITFGEFLNTTNPQLDLGAGVVINNADMPVVGKSVEVAAEPEVVPPRQRTPPALEPARLQCRVCLDNDTSMVLIPCGHMICGECRPNVISCPFCRAAIINVQRFFV